MYTYRDLKAKIYNCTKKSNLGLCNLVKLVFWSISSFKNRKVNTWFVLVSEICHVTHNLGFWFQCRKFAPLLHHDTTIQSQQLLIHHGIGYFKLALMDRNMQVRFGLVILRLWNFRHYNQFLWKVYSAQFIGPDVSHPQFHSPLLFPFSILGFIMGFSEYSVHPIGQLGKNAGYCNGICTCLLAICIRKANGSFHLLLTSSVFTYENIPQNECPVIWHTQSYTNNFFDATLFQKHVDILR